MFKRLPITRTCAAVVLGLSLAVTANLAQAQNAEGKELVRAAVNSALTPLIGNDSGDLVKRVLSIKPDGAISRNFNAARVVQATFGRGGAASAPDCRNTTTAAGEPDEGLCVLEAGKRDDPSGAYTHLAFSKNIGRGHIKFIKRQSFLPGASLEPASQKLTDADAYSQAMKFADLLGIPGSEIPQPPANAKNPYPVRSLVVGAEQERGSKVRYTIQKVVSLQRAFVVPGGLYKDPVSGIVLNHVLAPGNAVIAVTDAGVQFARITGWADAQLDSKLNPALAKTLKQLSDEITEDLYNEGVRSPGSFSVRVTLRQAYPHPDDPNPPLCPVCGVLRPALEVMVSRAGPGRLTTSEKNVATAGLVREYDLVASTEAERPSR
jgi:hypothetical protein